MPSTSSNAAHVLLFASPGTATVAVAAAANPDAAMPAPAFVAHPERPLRPGLMALSLSLLLHAFGAIALWQWIADFEPTPERPPLQVSLRSGGATAPATTAPVEYPADAPAPPATAATRAPRPAAPPQPRELAKTATSPAPIPLPATLTEPLVAVPVPAPPPTLPTAAEAGLPVNPVADTAVNTTTLRVLEWLAQHRRYPASARRERLQGTVEVLVVLMPDGRLVNQRIAQSSGHAVLDKAALELLRRASPLPSAAFFTGEARQLELRLPIVYRLSI